MNLLHDILDQEQRRDREGSALLMVIIVILIITTISTVSLSNSMAQLKLSRQQTYMEQAHFAAEAGVEEAARMIGATAYMGASDTTFSITLDSGATASVTITPKNNRGREFAIHSVGTKNGVQREVGIARVYKATYLDYGHFFEDFANLWWIYGNFVDGKTWTGNRQNIYGYTLSNGEKWGPVFSYVNEVGVDAFGGYPEYAAKLDPSIAFADAQYSDLRFWNDDPDGYDTNVQKPALLNVDFAETATIATALDIDPALIDPDTVSVASMPKGKALFLKGNTEMRFSTTDVGGTEVGILEIRNYEKFGNFDWNPVYSEAIDLIYVEQLNTGPEEHRGADVMLGDWDNRTANIIKGNMTIWAEDDVTIPSHLVYSDQNLETSNDKLGVISRDDIWLEQTFAGDLVIQGGFIATGVESGTLGEFGLLEWNQHGVRGNLYLTGSRVSQKVVPTAQFSGSTLQHGFNTIHQYDERFIEDPPPFTPALDSELRYEGWY